MARAVRLFVSSSPDLAAEREALGQAVAELPVSVGWEIQHTPGPGGDASEGLTFIAGCDLFVIVLGRDFAAPMGLEWERALGAARPRLAYRWNGPSSPSARSLLRQSSVTWTVFDAPLELKVRFARSLAKILLDRGEQFGLHLDDVTGLLQEAAGEPVDSAQERDRRRGAGQSAVILGRGSKAAKG